MLEMYSLAIMVLAILALFIAELLMFKDKLTKKEILSYILYFTYILILLICFLIIVPPEFFDSEKSNELPPVSIICGGYFYFLIFLNFSLSLLTPLSSIFPNTIIDMFRKEKKINIRIKRIKHIFVYILLLNVIIWGFFIYLYLQIQKM